MNNFNSLLNDEYICSGLVVNKSHIFKQYQEITHVIEYEKDSTSYIVKSITKNNKGIIGAELSIDIDSNKLFSIKQTPYLCFIPIDGNNGLLANSNCDFVFISKGVFCFVELKLNATSTEERAIRKNRKKAICQLENTITHFRDKVKDYFGHKIIAYLATPDIYPRGNTSFQELRVAFLERVGVELYESRTISI